MKFKQSVTYKYSIKIVNHSYELNEKINKYLLRYDIGAFMEYYDCIVSIIVKDKPIPSSRLEAIETLIPKWIKEIKANDKSNFVKDVTEVETFLKSYKLPVIEKKYLKSMKKKPLVDMLNLIKDYRNDAFYNFITSKSSGEINACLIDDIRNFTEMFNIIKVGDVDSAYKLYKSLDTAEREVIPESVRNLILVD